MKYRKFGNTELVVSEIGFGAWGIGGPAMAGDIPIGWGEVNNSDSVRALENAFDLGINFFDTADFYGLGLSEKLIGDTFSNSDEVIIATKVGHRLEDDDSIKLDYSKEYILGACDKSLGRLKRERIDYYQLHSARVSHLKQGECIEAMEQLVENGKVRYWGVSLNTFNPEPEAEFMMRNNLASGFQLVLNIINQRAIPLVLKAAKEGYGIIARMPIQFGLLTGKFMKDTKFDKNDHRYFRLTPEFLTKALDELELVWPIADKYGISKTSLSLSFILTLREVSTVIPGIKTPEQAKLNITDLIELNKEDFDLLRSMYSDNLFKLVELMEKLG
ncbi:aldo/keto reductase [Bacteroidota bacterium]